MAKSDYKRRTKAGNIISDRGKAAGFYSSRLRILDEAERIVLRELFSQGRHADKTLTGFFRAHPQCGSKDRAFIADTTNNLLRVWGWLRRYLPEARRNCVEKGNIALTHKELMALNYSALFILDPQSDALGVLRDASGAPKTSWQDTALGRAKALAVAFGADTLITMDNLIPEWMGELLPENWPTEALLSRPPLWLRLQTPDQTSVIKELESMGARCQLHSKVPNALMVRSGRLNLHLLSSYTHGACEIQDLASQCVGLITAPRPGERWFDPCAGAGGKTLHMAWLMKQHGVVEAGDIRENKLLELRRRARRSGFPNITAHAHNGKWHGRHPFYGVLVDAPCSGSGVWRRNPGGAWNLTPEKLNEYSTTQLAILENFSRAVQTGGVLIYATCSIFDCENSGVVEKFLAAHPEFKLEPFDDPITGLCQPGMGNFHDPDSDFLFAARMRKWG